VAVQAELVDFRNSLAIELMEVESYWYVGLRERKQR
jgi:hypothetical protein